VFNGTSSTLDLNRAVSSDDKDDCHAAMYHSALGADARGVYFSHTADTTTGALSLRPLSDTAPPTLQGRFRSNEIKSLTATGGAGFTGGSRASAAVATYRWNDDSEDIESASTSGTLGNYRLGRYYTTYSAGVVGFYSAGSATDLALLDARVSTLMADLRAIEETGFDRDAIAYLRAVEEADGAFLETSVKVAINNLVSGLKADGLWDAIGSSCLLCGPRTLAGALVPLRGDAPTAYGFVQGDFDRLGLQGDGTSYLDSNRAANLTSDSDLHFACYLSTSISDNGSPMGVSSAASNASFLRYSSTVATWCNSPSGSAANASQVNNSGAAGFYGATRTTDLEFFCRNAGTAQTKTAGAGSLPSSNYYIFADNAASGIRQVSTSSISFYSIGAGLTGDSAGLAKLDTHISSYVTAIGAAL
jgi:hypothetical protein